MTENFLRYFLQNTAAPGFRPELCQRKRINKDAYGLVQIQEIAPHGRAGL